MTSLLSRLILLVFLALGSAARSQPYGPGAFGSAPSGWNVVSATGIAATDLSNLTNAFASSATQPVFMTPGTYNVCAQLTVPDRGVVSTIQGNTFDYFGGVAGKQPTAKIQCSSGIGTFAPGQAFVVAGNYSRVTGLAVFGLAGTRTDTTATVTMTIASPAVVTWTASNLVAGQPVTFTTSGALPTGVVAGQTYYVIATGLTANSFRFSATVGGAAVNTSGTQSGTQTGNANADFGVDCFSSQDVSFTTYDSDLALNCRHGFNLSNNGAVVSFTQGHYLFRNRASFNRGWGIYTNATNSGSTGDLGIFENVLNANFQGGMYFTFSGDSTFQSNSMGDNGKGPPTPGVGLEIDAGYGATITGNTCDRNEAQCMSIGGGPQIGNVAGGGGLSRVNITGNTSHLPFWLQGNTGSTFHIDFFGIIDQLHMSGNSWWASTATECSGSDLSCTNYVYKVEASSGFTNSFFGEQPVSGLNGIYFDALTLQQIQPLVAQDYAGVNNGTFITPDLDFNQLAGQPSMTAGWATTNSAFANGISPDPLNQSGASRITENAATGQHMVTQSLSLPAGTATLSTYVHTGSSGTRHIGLEVFDSTFAHSSQAFFNPSTCALDFSFTSGSGVVTNTGAVTDAGAPAGWCRIWMTFTLGTGNLPAHQDLVLISSGSDSYAGDNASNLLVWGPQFSRLSKAAGRSTASPGNPTGTTSTAGLMMGLAGTFTPYTSGTLNCQISGDITNSVSGDGANVQLRFGTGTAPVNAAALTGTTAGGLVKFVAASATNKVPFTVQGLITGLTPGVPVWLDVGLAAVTGGTATIADVNIVAVEQ